MMLNYSIIGVLVAMLLGTTWILLLIVRVNEDLRHQVEDSRVIHFEQARHITGLAAETHQQREQMKHMAIAIVMVLNDKSRELVAAHRYIGRLLEEKADSRQTLRLVRDNKEAAA